ncbi:iron-containing alcohol dehydrogenase family protein [Sporolactobacillus sp. KGMB 08714]|uniref:iron-containing alcohol dehydrogenase family protein n=1 Tax=Sporolactobacillus sp. KGMB 08714 TaxID=3064704 RepID=UPI002FBD570B
MSFHLVSRIAPQQYISEKGAYDYLAGILKKLSVRRVLFLHGIKSLHKAAPYLPDLAQAGIETFGMSFGGECSPQEIDRVIQAIKTHDADLIIGLGGGKVMDTAKASAYKAGRLPLVLMPTMASNCAAWSALSVFYKDNGESIGFQTFPNQSALVLVEPRVILDSPIEYFIAGIADTLAKWYESNGLLAKVDQNHLAILYARESAKLCHDIPLEYAVQAVDDMRQGILSNAWNTVMETNIMASGLVGGFADQYGSATAAHSVHDALTFFPETKPILHGVKVAYGIMVQLALEGKWDEIRRLQPFYQKLNLPMNLTDLHLGTRPESDIRQLAARAVSPDKTIHLLPYEVTAESVFSAINQLETLSAHRKEGKA